MVPGTGCGLYCGYEKNHVGKINKFQEGYQGSTFSVGAIISALPGAEVHALMSSTSILGSINIIEKLKIIKDNLEKFKSNKK